MSRIIEIINNLPELLQMQPASDEQITAAEIDLKVCFSDEYKEYLKTFGAIMADGIELSGIAKSEYRNVISMTKQEWELNSNVPHTMYVIENTHIDGIVTWQDNSGCIYKTEPNKKPVKIADTMAEYLVNRCGQYDVC